VTIVACCNARGAFIPPFFIFKRAHFTKMCKQELPSGSEIEITDSGCINDDVFSGMTSTFS
jgi:hypothetical protein